jgi:hypothetical protein
MTLAENTATQTINESADLKHIKHKESNRDRS